MSSIAVVGIGNVGATISYTLAMKSACQKLIMVDITKEKQERLSQDVSQAAVFVRSNTQVEGGSFQQAGQSDLIVVAIVSRHRIGETTLDRNHRVVANLQKTIDMMQPIYQNAVLLIISRPTEVLCSVACKLSKLPEEQVVGTGTVLASAQLQSLIVKDCGAHPPAVNAYVLGGGCDHQVIPWSGVSISGPPSAMPPQPDVSTRERVSRHIMRENIMEEQVGFPLKFSIASMVFGLCSSIMEDKRDVYPITHFSSAFQCWMGWPALLGRSGLVETMALGLDQAEEARLEAIADALRNEQQCMSLSLNQM